LSRVFVVWVTAGYFQGDCGTYFQQGVSWWAGQVPYRDYVVEYPPAAVTVFALVAAVGSYPAFRVLFAALMLALDACVFWMVRRGQVVAAGCTDGAGRPAGAGGDWAYLLATVLLFPVLYVRFDLLPAAATLGACLLLEPAFDRSRDPPGMRRLIAGGALLGLGIAWKLYPLLIGPFLLLQLRRQARRVLMVGVAAAAVVGLSFVPVLVAGAGRAALSFLKYQGERGLQIESSYASVLMVANGLVPIGVHHQMSHHAHDLAGALPDALAPWTRPLQLLAVVAVSVLAHRRRLPLTQAFAAVVATALSTSNVLSPQFLIWLVPLAVVVVGSRQADRTSAALLVAAAALTSLVFPLLYPRLLQLTFLAAGTLFLRNACLVALAVRLTAPTPTR
jgi:hypothetical protein